MSLIRNDWSLERRGPVDQARHQEKVRAAIRDNLQEIVSDASIFATDGKTILKVPIRTVKEYKFRFDPQRERKVGQGTGGTSPGQIVARGRSDPSGTAPGRSGGDPGVDVYEAEVSLEDLDEVVFADLALPHLERKAAREVRSMAHRFGAVRRTGAMTALDKRRSILENVKRNARAGHPEVGEWSDQDLRFRSFRARPREHAAAAVIAMRDVSGSMGEFKKYVTRSFFFWMVRFLRTKYDNLDIVFLAHHIDAREVDEQAFFHLGESGGTRVSSAYQLALQVVEERYDPARWNIYPFHFSDGDNWGDADNRKCLGLVERLLSVSSAFGYGEINEGGYTSPLMATFAGVRDPRFVAVSIHDRRDVYPALKRFFTPTAAGG